jgi:phage-related protein
MKKSRFKATADMEKWKETQITTIDEFEGLLARAAVELAKNIELEKEAQAAGQVSQKLQQVSQVTQTASTELGNFLDQAQNLAVDSEEEEETPLTEEEEQERAKAALVHELGKMAFEAANQSNTKLAYKIERAIDSILFEEE